MRWHEGSSLAPEVECGESVGRSAYIRGRICRIVATESRPLPATTRGVFGTAHPGYRRDMTTVDRIADPWGSRTPYGPGQRWPTRVDTYLADGLTEDDVISHLSNPWMSEADVARLRANIDRFLDGQ